MSEKPSKGTRSTKPEEQRQDEVAASQDQGAGGGDDSGAGEVQAAVAEAQDKGYYGETHDPYGPDEYTATGNQGRTAHEDRAKAVNPEGHGHAVSGSQRS